MNKDDFKKLLDESLKPIQEGLGEVKQDLNTVKEEVGGIKQDLQEIKQTQESHTGALMKIEATMNGYADAYKTNKSKDNFLTQLQYSGG